MKKLIFAAAAVLLLAAGCSGQTSVNTTPPAPSTITPPATSATPSQAATGNLTLGIDSTSTLGSYLIATNGMTLYTYAPDGQNTSNCTGSCASAWPPYIVSSSSDLQNLEAGVVGTVNSITRSDSGAMQVTYNGHPLYFFKNDVNPGDANGQGVGGVWFVVKP